MPHKMGILSQIPMRTSANKLGGDLGVTIGMIQSMRRYLEQLSARDRMSWMSILALIVPAFAAQGASAESFNWSSHNGTADESAYCPMGLINTQGRGVVLRPEREGAKKFRNFMLG